MEVTGLRNTLKPRGPASRFGSDGRQIPPSPELAIGVGAVGHTFPWVLAAPGLCFESPALGTAR